MQTGEILWLAFVLLAVLGGLVALGVGHKRWNIGTVVAGILVLLAAATFLYLAARLAERDRSWKRRIDDYVARIEKATDDRQPVAGGAGWEEGPESLAKLQVRRDRWRRGLDRVDTWRGRVWQNASFQPPKDDASSGRVELAAEKDAEDSPPIGIGAHVFLFDAIPYEEGGAYIGEFIVQSTAYDQGTKRHTLTVAQSAPRDAYDAKVLERPHDAVTVFEELPVDRWLAFYRTRKTVADDAGEPLPRTDKEDADKVQELLESSPEVGTLVEQFVETFRQHEEEVPKDEWPDAEKQAIEQPGTLWAEVEFTKPHSFRAAAEPAPADGEAAAAAAVEDGPRQDYESGDRAEFDLGTAVDLRDTHEAVEIQRVIRRRPLTDALTLLHGGRPGGQAEAGDPADVDGTATLLRLLQNELAALERSNRQLEAAQQAATANTEDEMKVVRDLTQDLETWKRDAEAAGDLADGFQRQLDTTTRALTAAEAAIVARGRELAAAMTRLAAEIDRVAPPPERRAAVP